MVVVADDDVPEEYDYRPDPPEPPQPPDPTPEEPEELGPRVEVPTPEGAPRDLVVSFWRLVLVFNVALLAAWLGVLFLVFEANLDLGGRLLAVGGIAFAYGYYRYRTNPYRDGVPTDDDSEDGGDPGGGADDDSGGGVGGDQADDTAAAGSGDDSVGPDSPDDADGRRPEAATGDDQS